jgi:hypothetical protein
MGAHTSRTIPKIVIGMRKMEQKNLDLHAAKKGRMKPNPTKHSFVQLSKKMDRLEKAIKKQDAKRKKHCHSNSDSKSE